MSGTGNVDVATVLVVDDDRAVRESLDRALRLEGYRVMMASDGLALFDVIEATPPDLIVLDVMMPNVDGITACRRLRDRGDRTPILILTARDAVSDRVAGLDAGADDYLPKPFALEELLARTRALLRRNAPDEDAAELVVDDLRLDARRREVHRGERLLELTKTEFDLLELLAHHAGQVLTNAAAASGEAALEIEFLDDRITAVPVGGKPVRPAARPKPPGGQGSLF